MKLIRMTNEQRERFHNHIKNIRRKYSSPDTKLEVGRTLKNATNLIQRAGYPVANIEYFPQANVAVVVLASDDYRRSVMTAYVRENEIEFRYDTESFARFKKPADAALWLEEF